MSKRNSVGQSNTLLNYFASPKSNAKPKVDVGSPKTPKTPKTPKIAKTPKEESKTKKKIIEDGGDSDEELVEMPKKRRRIIENSSSESGENESPNKPKSKKRASSKPKQTQKKARVEESDYDFSGSESEYESESPSASESSEDEKPTTTKKKTSKKASQSNKSLQSFSFSSNTKSESSIKESEKSVSSAPETDIHTNWKHNRLDFLKPNHIRDANKRRPNDPDYDWRTLYLPPDFLKDLSPGMRQWWELKSKHMDSILFFKVGKFYELYHMDAVIGVTQIGLTYMKGEFAHSGFPEQAYGKMASALIEKGFKVARVEQTETPQMMSDRCKSMKKTTRFDKVVKREICQISTKATCVYTGQMQESNISSTCYLYAISEKIGNNGNVRYGVCFIDTTIGVFHLSEFDDDKHSSRLLVILAEYPPGLILTERGAASPHLQELLNTHFSDIRKDTLAPKTQFYSATTTLQNLNSGCYFYNKNDDFEWPEFFKSVADDCMPKPEYELALKCLGACLWYLKDSQIDIQVFSMKKFELYKPLDLLNKEDTVDRDFMVLDATTINNLCLLGKKGTLEKNLDFCETAFGKRYLLRWICRPLCSIQKITERQLAVKELWNNPSLLKAAQEILKKLPDLERQIAKIHTYGNRFCAKDHPDARAILYEADTYSKRKIQDLLKTLKGFEIAQEIPELFADSTSFLLRKITQFAPEGMNVDLSQSIQFFKDAFDQKEAETSGKIIPKSGVDADYDAVEDRIKEINKELSLYLKEQSKYFGCSISYFGTDKKRFQLEVPDQCTKKITSDYQLESTKKGAKRYSTAQTKKFLLEMQNAEAERAKIILDLNRRIFEKFSDRYEEWETATQCLTFLDVLCSLAQYAKSFPQDICIPELKPFSSTPQIVIKNGRHPCISNIDNFVPNDTEMGSDGLANILIITGPNMGGKSTLMRQIATISIMAQMGSCVPAEYCSLTLIDRVFTRLGAHDDILQGQSTFFVELSEASSILQHATRHSLVLLDELGRGTSTHDGNAIATAYVKKLTQIQCRTLFSTHYHSLVDHFVGDKTVQLGHMACMVENDEDPTEESVTFLYKMAEGRCPKSYGFNAAKLAGLKNSIIVRGRQVAKELEIEDKNRKLFRKMFSTVNVSELRSLISSLKI